MESEMIAVKIAEMQRDIEFLTTRKKQVVETIEKGFKELNEKVRKLEDRSLIGQFLEKLLWLAIGAFITVVIHQNYIAVVNRDKNGIEKTAKKNK